VRVCTSLPCRRMFKYVLIFSFRAIGLHGSFSKSGWAPQQHGATRDV
jgi:hypothetical protein